MVKAWKKCVYWPKSRPFSNSSIKQSRKFTFTFEERNDALAKYPRSALYPVLPPPRAPLLPLAQIKETFKDIEHTQTLETPQFEIRGRIQGVRAAGRGLLFLDVVNDEEKIQVVVNAKKAGLSKDDQDNQKLLRPGDSVAVCGRPWRTQSGELSLLASGPVTLLSPCLHPPLDATTGSIVRQHNRVAELKSFADARQVLRARDAAIAHIQSFFRDREFVHVQTPILSHQTGGATATPFVTEEDLILRIAPELWLKRLVIGGFDKVFEIGPSFRNEGIDATHNPEFTTCEFYMAFANLRDLMELTKELLVSTAETVTSRFPEYLENARILSVKEWPVYDYFETIETALGYPLPAELTKDNLIPILQEHGLDVDGTESRLLDRLCGHFIESKCINPSFIINHPAIMAPLAKQSSVEINGRVRQISHRFELMINGREYVNAYEEQNDPEQQLEMLKQQAKEQGLETVADLPYVQAMEWGLPPTGGWGLGIDRLVMLLTGSDRIHQVLTFGGINQIGRQ